MAMQKKLLLLIPLLIAAGFQHAYSQIVYSNDSKYDADVVVYVSNSKYEADLIVYKAGSKGDAGNDDGIWYFTTTKSEAKKKYILPPQNTMLTSLFALATAKAMQAGRRKAGSRSCIDLNC